MNTLTVFYDANCGLCGKFKAWLEAQPKRVAVEFLPFDSVEALEKFPSLPELGADREIVVLADDGRWWQGGAAWLTCLWATPYRDWSFRLATPVLQPFIRKVVHLVSENRLTISRLMKLRSDTELVRSLDAMAKPKCPTGACAV